MARTRTRPDTEILELLLTLLEAEGEKALSFGEVSRRCGLAPATLAQRFGSVEEMIRSGLRMEWGRLDASVAASESDATLSTKGAQALLKHLAAPSVAVLTLTLRDPELRGLAEAWRVRVERALAIRRGGGAKATEGAAILFAAWQGRALWEAAGGKAFRLADLLKAMP